jgi:cytochrome c-type biogenesis protein CcmH/NrfF
MLIISPLEQGSIVYWTATVWALVAGGLIISDALYQRARIKRERKTQGKQPELGEE